MLHILFLFCLHLHIPLYIFGDEIINGIKERIISRYKSIQSNDSLLFQTLLHLLLHNGTAGKYQVLTRKKQNKTEMHASNCVHSFKLSVFMFISK